MAVGHTASRIGCGWRVCLLSLPIFLTPGLCKQSEFQSQCKKAEVAPSLQSVAEHSARDMVATSTFLVHFFLRRFVTLSLYSFLEFSLVHAFCHASVRHGGVVFRDQHQRLNCDLAAKHSEHHWTHTLVLNPRNKSTFQTRGSFGT